MKSIIAGLAVLLLSAATAGAQATSGKASAGDSLLIRENVYRELFAGITVSPAQKARAQEVIANSERQQVKLGRFHNCEERQALVDVIAQRDSTLLGLMTNAADSARFARHAAYFVMGPCPFPKD